MPNRILHRTSLSRRNLLMLAVAVAARPRGASAAGRKFTIAYPDKSPPNSWQNGDGAMKGILVDLVAEIATDLGYAFEPVPLPLPRVQSGVESGAVDGMCLTITPARLAYAVPTAAPLTTGAVTLFVRRDNPMLAQLGKVRSLDDLARTGATVVAIEGNGWIRENVESRGIRTVFANGTIGTVRMLIGGRGDVIVDMSHQINWLLKEVKGGDAIVEMPAVMDQVDWHLLISRKSPFLAEMPKLNDAVLRLQQSGKVAAILQRYGIKV